MNCQELKDKLYAFLDQELAEADATAIRAHLDGCLGCDEEILFERRFLEHLRDCCTSDRAPSMLRQRIVIRLRELDRSS